MDKKHDVRVERSPDLLKNDFISVKRHTLSHRLFNGDWSDSVERVCCYRAPAVVVIPFDPVLKKVVLVEQFRVGALESDNPWMIELVAGLVEEGENPEDVAHRELQEESGLDASKMIKVMDFWASPGYSAEVFSLYCAIVDSNQASGQGGIAEEGEDIRVHVMSLDEVFVALEKGHFQSAPAVLGLQWLQLHQDIH